MEIILRNKFGEEKIVEWLPGHMISIQGVGVNSILENLVSDYETNYINSCYTYFVGSTVKEEMTFYHKNYDYEWTSQVLESLGLSSSFLEREVSTLSHTEKIFLNLIRNMDQSKKIVIFDDIFQSLDYFHQKKMKHFLSFLKEHLYIIVFTSRDVNCLYELAEDSIVWTKKFFRMDSTDSIYTDVSMLQKNRLKVPTLPLITYKAKTEKNVKLFYSKDVRDIIKDIYKHV